MRRCAVVIAIACGCHEPPAAVVVAPAPVAPLAFEVVDAAGHAVAVRWSERLEIPAPSEYDGVFAYAQRKTVLHAGDARIGWLEPGARVPVFAATRDRVEVALSPWAGVSARGRAHAWVMAGDLGPIPPANAPPFSRATHAEKLIASGQTVRSLAGVELGYTFCGDVEVLGTEQARVHVIQREAGVVVEGLVDAKASWARSCPRALLVADYKQRRSLVLHDRFVAYDDPAPPAGLVEVGPFKGPTIADEAARRGTLYWLVDGEHGATCVAWQLVPPKQAGDDGALETREIIEGGDTLVTRFGFEYGPEPNTGVTLLGPSSEIIPRPGHTPEVGTMAMGCGESMQVVASDPSMITMHLHPPAIAATILAYDPHDTEHWYLDRARCEHDAGLRSQHVALAFVPHQGC